MIAMAAREMGYAVEVLDPSATCAAAAVVDRVHVGHFDDDEVATQLARRCDVVTLEIEKLAPSTLAAVARHAPLRPGPAAVELVQHRGRQKRWLAEHGFPVGPFRVVDSAAELSQAVRELGGPCHVKSCTGGYDGRGQATLAPDATAEAVQQVWRALGESTCLVELTLSLQHELSVLVARRPGGQQLVYPLSLNHHDDGILTWASSPAAVAEPVAQAARELGGAIAGALDLVGLLAVELFLTTDGQLLVNELAPRPHNSFHHTVRLCATSQFEQLVRAVCDLPLGDVAPLSPAAIVNLLGDLWLGGHEPRWQAALEVPGVRIHLYGKGAPRAGRKMGHLSAIGATAEEAHRRAAQAYGRLTGAV
jgi:5-(carboxyamino)imidazole ribonucleotide synthase